MDRALSARRLKIFALQHSLDLECGRVYPRVTLVDLLVDILVCSKGMEKRAATGMVRAAFDAVAVACTS